MDRIVFVEDMAAIDVAVENLDMVPLKNHERGDSPRLKKLVWAIRLNGYNSLNPVIVRLGRRGRWVVVDGGHRLTAAKKVAGEWWSNLFSKKVHVIHFILFRTPLSETLKDVPPREDDEEDQE